MSLLHRTRDSAFPPADLSGDEDPGGRRISARVHTIGCSGLRTSMVRGFRMSSGDGADVAGFDLGPSPEEHFLAALGASISQTISHLACVRGLSIDRVDVDLTGELAPDHDHALVDALSAGAELPCHVLLTGDPLLGQVRVQLERQPAHGWLGSIGMLLAVKVQRLFQLALPDEAPGSNHVRDDVYLQCFFAHGFAKEEVARGSWLVTRYQCES